MKGILQKIRYHDGGHKKISKGNEFLSIHKKFFFFFGFFKRFQAMVDLGSAWEFGFFIDI